MVVKIEETNDDVYLFGMGSLMKFLKDRNEIDIVTFNVWFYCSHLILINHFNIDHDEESLDSFLQKLKNAVIDGIALANEIEFRHLIKKEFNHWNEEDHSTQLCILLQFFIEIENEFKDSFWKEHQVDVDEIIKDEFDYSSSDATEIKNSAKRTFNSALGELQNLRKQFNKLEKKLFEDNFVSKNKNNAIENLVSSFKNILTEPIVIPSLDEFFAGFGINPKEMED